MKRISMLAAAVLLAGAAALPVQKGLAVATERKLPDFAIGICTLRIEEPAPKLRAVLARAANGEVLSDDESLLLFRGLHILGAARDRSCQPLLRLLRRPLPELEEDDEVPGRSRVPERAGQESVAPRGA